MIRFFSVLVLCFCCSVIGFSQVEVEEDFPIDNMMKRYAAINSSKQTVGGWRIQIMAKTDRIAIEQEKEKFIQEFPGVTIDWTHSKPYYRLRAGAFQTKLEAIQTLQSIKKKYPGAFPVNDSILKQELIPSF